ncbi:MarR family transcriptional regulator [Streptomyces sp. TRM75563]|uniref:MarR family transcriptional regulator n=1 Tax=Streptomyces sp. TRM75563 TaxID=2817418 RepID=UPI001F60C2E1|nr:MarR family transcriptional regulator [Streptomyces sp. TRM75563]MCI4044818.1 MarR family transcriptional regulator [Streptomyces sp. TRM75563]
MANPGYGKRSAPDQQARTRHDFALLPTRERYVAGFVDHLPEGASMSVKQLAKQLPLYGQQAISTALNALSVAGHLRRVRCSVTNASDETRWVFRTFWSRTARDNEWWNTYLATENSTLAASSGPDIPASDAALPPLRGLVEEPPPAPEGPGTEQAPELPAVPHQRTSDQGPAPDAEPAPEAARDAESAPPAPEAATSTSRASDAASPAYLALARLGRDDHRLTLSAADCAALEAQATEWLDRGVTVDYLTGALTAGLPAQVDSPLGFVRRRLIDKIPPRLPTGNARPPAPARRILMECTDCGRPGRPEALFDGLCRPCREAHSLGEEDATRTAEIADVKLRMSNLRELLKPV